MDAATQEMVAAVVASCARRYARAWSSIAADEFTQQGWLIALEAMPRHNPDTGPLRPYIRGSVMRGLFNYAHRTSQPVHTPRNKEHLFWDRARHAPAPGQGVSAPHPSPEAALSQVEMAVMVREAVGVATRRFPDLHDVLLGDATPMDLAATTDESNLVWGRRVKRARAHLRDHIRIPRSDLR